MELGPLRAGGTVAGQCPVVGQRMNHHLGMHETACTYHGPIQPASGEQVVSDVVPQRATLGTVAAWFSHW